MPDPSSTLEIVYDGATPITTKVRYSDARFELQAGAVPGTAEMTIIDRDQTASFTTGREIQATVDGQGLWGGYLVSATRRFAFPAVNTKTRAPSQVKERIWVLRAVDYNILFDKRVLRNPSDYLHQLPNFGESRYDGDLIRNDLCPIYLDVPAGFNTTDHVDDVVPPFDPLIEGGSGEGAWLQQGSTWREQMEDFAQFSGAVWYLTPDKYLEYHSLESSLAPWGFSDTPDGVNFIGFRNLELVETGGPSTMVNDAMVWGGSEFAGNGQTVFAREENLTSQSDHQRWQRAETHFGEKGYLQQRGVSARADVIVNGAPGAVGGDPNRGLRFPQWTVTLEWWAKDVPVIAGQRRHLRPGDIVTFNFWVMSEDGGSTPLTLVLPLRDLNISFPLLRDNGQPVVLFRGTFSLQLSDPYTLWSFIRKALHDIKKKPAQIATANASSPSATYGTLFSGPFDASPDGVTVQFSLPSGFGYVAGTTAVYQDGKLLIPGGVDYSEVNPVAGTIEFTTAPGADAELWVRCNLT